MKFKITFDFNTYDDWTLEDVKVLVDNTTLDLVGHLGDCYTDNV